MKINLSKKKVPDLLIWCHDTKTCKIVEFSCPADVNVTKKIQEKEDNYGPLIRMLHPLDETHLDAVRGLI